ncbi:MAG TPA: hypothetical protein VH327_07845 [Gammaproteobacteria bacterium]|nr:hypothetical protein [Gammaproteobacteria bacterium]
MPRSKSFPLRAIAWACLAVAQLVWLPTVRADGIPVAPIVYKEIKLAGNSGNVFALGFMPFEAGKLYWTTDEGGMAHLYTYDLGSQAAVELDAVIPPSFLPSGFVWSPDGRQAAMIRGPALKLVGIGVRATHNLFLGTGQWGPMFWTPNRSILSACAPDAQVSRRLCAVDTSTGLVTVLAAPGEGSVYAVGYIEGVNKVIYERWNPGEAPNPVHIYSASIFSDHVGNVMPLAYPDISGQGYLTVTPDGRYGVTIGQATQAKGKISDVYLGDFSTGNWTRVSSRADWGQASMAVLSPDHRYLVVATPDGKGGYRLWLADVPDKVFDSLGASH